MECPNCGHAADLHGLVGWTSGCMVKNPEECACALKWEQVEAMVWAVERLPQDVAP